MHNIVRHFLTIEFIHTGPFLAGAVPGGGGAVEWSVFHLHPVTPLSLTSDDSNFVQNYFGVGSIFWGKKNRIKLIMTSLCRHLCSDEYRKLLKTAYFKIIAASLCFIECY